MPDYTTLGIGYPVPGDNIKAANVAAKLADDMKALAVSANQAIIAEGARAEAAAKSSSDAKDAVQDAQLAGLTSAVRTRGTLPAGDLFALSHYSDNGIYSLNAATTYTNSPFTGSGSLTVLNDYQNPGMLMLQRDNTGETWFTQTTTADGGSFTGWAQMSTTRGKQLTTEHLDTVITPGNYWVRTNAEAVPEKGWPFPAYGNVRVLPESLNDANITQVVIPSQRWATGWAMRSRYNTVWGAWTFFRPSDAVVAEAVAAAKAAIPAASGGSGFKVVPLALTLGQTGADAPTTRCVRFPLSFAAPIPRFRVHIRNWNPRLGLIRTGAVNFTGLWLGKHAGNGEFTAAPTQLRGGFATPEDGSEWVSTWFNSPIGQGDYLLSYGYTAPAAPYALVGGSWQSATPADAALTAPTVTRSITTGFDVWIEAETPATTPVVGMLGDSLSCGVGATLPVYDSVISQYARKIGALPYHLAASGDSMVGMMTVNPAKVTRWANLTKPDSILWALGSNDLADATDLATMQARFLALLPTIQGISPTIYLADIMPRDGWAAGSVNETVRRQYNNWLRTLPGGARDVFAFAASISTDDETITPAYNADGTHLNTLGYTKNMEALVRPLSASPSDTGPRKCVRLEAGSWVWDTTAGTHYVIPDYDGALVVRATAFPVPAATPAFNW